MINKLKTIPLVVDFDGTLMRSDTFWEALMWGVKNDWRMLARVVMAYLTHGRAAAKLEAEATLLEVDWQPMLPYNAQVLELMAEARKAGRKVVIATGSPSQLIEDVIELSDIKVDAVIGTDDPGVNMTAANKAAVLVKRFGEKGFDYAGNSGADMAVWPHAREAIIVNPTRDVKTDKLPNATQQYLLDGPHASPILKTMRPHQWLKNMLVFVPILTAHAWLNPVAWMAAVTAFVCFSLIASGVYVLNDLLDMDDDRAHPTKRHRPLAAGILPIPLALAMVPVLTLAGFGLAAMTNGLLVGVLAVYWLATVGYSFHLKRWPVWDVLTLAGLYCVRIIGGAVATGIPLSFWLMLLALLGFYSLAVLKRYIELRDLLTRKGKQTARGYHVDDTPLLAAQGVGSGILAVGVVALYLQSPAVLPLYANPAMLGLICPLALWWLGRVWFLAHRGEVHDDPVVFAAKDPASWMCLLIAIAIVVGAS